MPHLVLEYSANVIEKKHLDELLQRCNRLLEESLPTEISNCKSRAYVCDIYSVGAGAANAAFVHVDLKVMAGRTLEKLQTLGQDLLTMLNNHFAESRQKLQLQITLEISELAKTYFKLAV